MSHPIPNSKLEFVALCLAAEALRFGEFTLKSGRTSPYFFNAGQFHRGDLVAKLGEHYANLIAEHIATENGEFMLYGPAYKGIPLVAVTALKLAECHGRNLHYAFNRKEAKAHGEGGDLVGAPLRGKVLILDDVITAGTSIDESIARINAAGATADSVFIALDRQEIAMPKNAHNAETLSSAVQTVQQKHRIPVHAILTLSELIGALEHADLGWDAATAQNLVNALKAHRQRYRVGAT